MTETTNPPSRAIGMRNTARKPNARTGWRPGCARTRRPSENAQAKLKGLGHSAKAIGEIMANVRAARRNSNGFKPFRRPPFSHVWASLGSGRRGNVARPHIGDGVCAVSGIPLIRQTQVQQHLTETYRSRPIPTVGDDSRKYHPNYKRLIREERNYADANASYQACPP